MTLKIKLCLYQKKEKGKNLCARDKKLFIFIFESWACRTIKRDTMKASKKCWSAQTFQIFVFAEI
jgi:hypothetical protein